MDGAAAGMFDGEFNQAINTDSAPENNTYTTLQPAQHQIEDGGSPVKLP